MNLKQLQRCDEFNHLTDDGFVSPKSQRVAFLLTLKTLLFWATDD